ncbi:MAG: M56 family metallopeptidase [Bacteroidota bacterium]
MIPLLESLGEASVSAFWIPVAVWSAAALATEAGVRRWGGRAPATAYRLAQAVLFALPLGLALSLLVSPEWLASFKPEVVLTVTPASGTDVPVALPPLETIGTPMVTFELAIGVLTLVVAASGLIGLGRIALQAHRLHRLRRALPEVNAEAAQAEATAVAAQVGLRAVPDVRVTPAEVVPMTLGVWRPLVVLPDRLEAADRRLALAHEFQHIRQADPLAHGAEAVTEAVFAFHPLVARLVRRCDLYREMTCDAAVLAGPEVDRRAYAALISSFATSVRPSWSPVAVGMAARIPHVHQRLLAMTHFVPSHVSRLAGPVALAVLASGILLMTVGRAAAQPARVMIVETPRDSHLVVERAAPVGTVVESDEVREHDGVDGLIRVTTRAASGRLATEGAAQPMDSVSAPGGAIFWTRTTEVDGPDTDSVAVSVYHREGQGGVTVRHMPETGGTVVARSADCESASEAPCAAGEVRVVEAAPLVFVDGVRVVSLDVAPDDIASVEVIKGENALVYGATEGQGVVRITTQGAARRAAPAEAAAEPASGFSILTARPNPAVDEVEIGIALPEAESVRVEVYDLTGRLVLLRVNPLPAGTSSVRFDVSDLPAGAYVVRATATVGGRQQTATSRFTVRR